MAFVFDSTTDGALLEHPHNYVPSAETLNAIDRIMSPLPDDALASQAKFDAFVISYVAEDLAWARGGNMSSPWKAATDVLRDVRDNLRYAIDFGGLTELSHKQVMDDFCPIMNRVAVGPPMERNAELLALLDAGIMTFGPGPEPKLGFDESSGKMTLSSARLSEPARVTFDVLVKAKLDAFIPSETESPLYRNMLSRGVVRPFMNGSYHPGGIDITRQNAIISANGQAHGNIWALGVPAEGPNFYTFVLPRPFVNSRFVADAGRCVLRILADIERRSEADAPGGVQRVA
jgi:hypothetical protein